MRLRFVRAWLSAPWSFISPFMQLVTASRVFDRVIFCNYKRVNNQHSNESDYSDYSQYERLVGYPFGGLGDKIPMLV
jgi:hypothetical protein